MCVIKKDSEHPIACYKVVDMVVLVVVHEAEFVVVFVVELVELW